MHWLRKPPNSPFFAKCITAVIVIVFVKGCALLPSFECDSVEHTIQIERLLKRGDKAPAFSLRDLVGDEVAVYDVFAQHNRVLVSFWGSWCEPCLRKLPSMIELYRKFGDDGFEIVGVALEIHEEFWAQTVVQYELSWKNLVSLDSWESEVAFSYGVSKVPTNFLVDSSGCIRRTDIPMEELSALLTAVYGSQE